ncbi:enoyl-CoA hydratase [Nocardioides mangrovicus]|uniref:enoyl-CoA hydratase n=1 Tax=Nocardioides mangrovicus TaxID=2478913 RepID=A0A3L8P5R8_9ACTN|nr:crotonase/enoyl-CoA hydratase family protein [Nocardioides mangrovicus]RLV50277.1 enoyl-CoA hydratase [Nocardioides mangrovicus]
MGEQSEPPVLVEHDGHVAIVTLNRPRAMNAVNRALATAVGEALEQAQADSDVRAVVVTGAGRGFCAGADLKEMASGQDSYVPGHRDWDFAGLVRHWLDKPVVAAVNGFALGGGTEIVLACDLVVIDEDAALGLPEVGRGLMAAAGGLIRLQRQVPFKVAAEVALTGEPVCAARAYELGLVNRVASAGTALTEAVALAQRIASNAPLAVQETKRMLHRAAHAGSDWGDAAWSLNESSMEVVLGSDDAAEGARAFVERRAPHWSGR